MNRKLVLVVECYCLICDFSEKPSKLAHISKKVIVVLHSSWEWWSNSILKQERGTTYCIFPLYFLLYDNKDCDLFILRKNNMILFESDNWKILTDFILPFYVWSCISYFSSSDFFFFSFSIVDFFKDTVFCYFNLLFCLIFLSNVLFKINVILLVFVIHTFYSPV